MFDDDDLVGAVVGASDFGAVVGASDVGAVVGASDVGDEVGDDVEPAKQKLNLDLCACIARNSNEPILS